MSNLKKLEQELKAAIEKGDEAQRAKIEAQILKIKEKVESDVETLEQKIARLEKENRELSEKVKTTQPSLDDAEMQYFKDLEYIDKHGQVGSNKIEVKEITDHKNLSLWHRHGKRVGPMHPENCKATLNRFRKKGVRLVVQRPTEEQIAEYKATPEYKKLQVAEDERRARKQKSKKKGELERIVAMMAQSYGLRPDQLNSVKDGAGVMSPGEAHKANV